MSKQNQPELYERIVSALRDDDKIREPGRIARLVMAAIEGAPVIHFVCDRIPDEKGCTFIEVEDASGASINAGRWEVRPDGLAQLVVCLGGIKP